MEPRRYQLSDRDLCLAVLASRSPDSRDSFASFLGSTGADSYTVLQHDDAILACGGYEISPAGDAATLRWGMVRRDWERQGLGRFLLLYRLRELTQGYPGVALVHLTATPETAGFYLKQGFKPAGPTAGKSVPLVMKMTVCP